MFVIPVGGWGGGGGGGGDLGFYVGECPMFQKYW